MTIRTVRALVAATTIAALLPTALPAQAAPFWSSDRPAWRFGPPEGVNVLETRPRAVSVQQAAPRHALAVPAPAQVSSIYLRREVDYTTSERTGTIVVDTRQHFLYLVLGNGRALRYGIGVARDGFEWSGTHRITRKAEWPSWTPPAEMRRRQPGLPTFMPGGPGNPMGARALYLGSTLYRIHGTVEPWTIGQNVSSGCIRMVNEDVIDLYERVQMNAKVVVLS
ncbi:L,D-transpeptidase [Devosia sediminis]|uniref:L,D-transpeptidase n=1 Tax=Devosia sediminis TaxID=2798801 RepID=A0A934IQ64_9HYPH|nr:L,D-transpeptidase [Devosia sediminis]MBJ3784793.1 L,D-transpeptidase [Devosia sediminis]